jgi:hypothetical protein
MKDVSISELAKRIIFKKEQLKAWGKFENHFQGSFFKKKSFTNERH